MKLTKYYSRMYLFSRDTFVSVFYFTFYVCYILYILVQREN